MPQILYPEPYNKPTHVCLSNIEIYNKLPNKTLADFITSTDVNELRKYILSKDIFVEITKTYIGYAGQYHELKIGDSVWYAPVRSLTIDNTFSPNFKLILEDRIELVPNAIFVSPITYLGTLPFSNFINRWIDEPELKVVQDSFSGNFFISVPLVQYNSTGTNEQLLERAKEALFIGTQYILKQNGKKFSKEYVNALLIGDNTRKAFFEFSKVVNYTIDPRGADNCSYLKFLISVPVSFINSLEDKTREEALADALRADIDEEADQDLNRLGAGDLTNASRYVYIRCNDIAEFDQHIDIIKKVIFHYNQQQDAFLTDFIDNHICLSDVPYLKLEQELDLAIEASKFDNFSDTIKNVLLINNVPVRGVNNSRDISVNKLAFAFDDDYNIVYFEVTRNGISYPLLKSSTELFLRDFGNGGLNSRRSGKLLYTITLDREYTKNLLPNDELRALKETYPFEQWVNSHVTPAPLDLNYPEKNMNCVKDSINKIREDAGIFVTNAENIKKITEAYNKEKLINERRNTNTFNRQWDEFSSSFSSANELQQKTWNRLRNEFLKEDIRPLFIQAAACLIQKIDQTAFLEFAQQFSSFFNSIKEKLIASFCNTTVIALFDVLSFIKIPRLNTSDPMEELARAVEESLIKLIIDIYKLIIKSILALLQLCSDPASPFNAANDLGLDNAIDQALNNAESGESPEVNNLYNALGYPDADTATEGTGGIGPQTRSRTTPEDKQKIKGLIGDIACLTTTSEFCSLMVTGNISPQLQNYITNIIFVKYPEYANFLGSNGTINFETLRNLLTKIGKALNIYDICVEINNVQPIDFVQVFCAEAVLSVKEREALAGRDIPPEILNEILDDLKKKRQKDLEDLAKSIEDTIANEVPILCSITEDGKPIPGLINAAKADPEYANMFKDNLKGCLSQVISEFNKEATSWKDNVFIKKSALSDALALQITNQIKNGGTGEQIRETLLQSGVLKVDPNNDKNLIPGPALLPTANTPIVTLEVAPNVLDSLSSPLFTVLDNKLTFKTTMKSYREEYIANALANLNAAANARAKQLIDSSSVQFRETSARALANATSGLLLEITRGGKIDWPTTLAGYDDNEKLSGIANGGGYLVALLISFIDSLGEYYGSPTSTTQRSTLQLPDRNINISTDEKTKIVPTPADKPEPPQVQELFAGGSNNLVPPRFPPMNINDMYIASTEALVPVNNFKRQIGNSILLKPFFDFIDNSIKNFATLLQELGKIETQLTNGYKQITTIHAAFPDYVINYQFGNKPPIGEEVVFNDGRLKNFYDLSILQSTHDANAQLVFGANEEVPIGYKNATANKPFLAQTNYELVDSELTNYIKTFTNLDDFKSSTQNLQSFVYENWISKKKPELQNISYDQILTQMVDAVRQQTSGSIFFKNTQLGTITSQRLNEFAGAIPSVPYILFLDLFETTATKAELECRKDRSLLDTDDIVDDTMAQFINDSCNFEPPQGSPRTKRKRMNPVEKNSSNAIIKATIRIYLYDYYLKGLFSLDTIRPAFVYENVMAEFFALMMESEMRAISNNYFNNFIDAVQKYYDERTARSIDDLLKPKNSDEFIKRTKLAQLIKAEMLEVSKRLGTKIREVDLSARKELNIARQNDNLSEIINKTNIEEAVIKGSISPEQAITLINLGISPETVESAGFVLTEIPESVPSLGESFYYGLKDASEPSNKFDPDTYPVVFNPLFGDSRTDKFKNAGSPYALLSILNISEPILQRAKFSIDNNNSDRFKKYSSQEKPQQSLAYDSVVIISDIKGGKDLDFRLLFEFLFPIRKIYSIMMIHNILSSNSRPEMKRAFASTKAMLANKHQSFMTRPNTNSLTAIPPSVSQGGIASLNALPDELREYFKKFIIDTLIQTPRNIIKGSVEGGGDLNGFLASIPYNIQKPLSLAFFNSVPYEQFPAFVQTPILSGIFSFVGTPFVPPLIPGFLTIAYLVTLGWWDSDWFKKGRFLNSTVVGAKDASDLADRILNNATDELDCEALEKIMKLTVDGKKLANIKKLDNNKEIE